MVRTIEAVSFYMAGSTIHLHHLASGLYVSSTLCVKTVNQELDHLDIPQNIRLIHYLDGIVLSDEKISRYLDVLLRLL